MYCCATWCGLVLFFGGLSCANIELEGETPRLFLSRTRLWELRIALEPSTTKPQTSTVVKGHF
jgi:hypothetical protein